MTRSLERELEIAKENLRAAREEHGANTEEMKAANQELHAMNEELRSASEELETSREELQSINEELVTVNQDLKAKVDELARSNRDTQNLMAATNVAVIFLDPELRIMRYTPPAVALFHLIAGDIGRPLVDLRHRLEFDSIVADAEDVLKNVKPIERAMRAHDGRHFLARTTAYRSADDRVEGVVLTFVDVTPLKKAETAMRESEARFHAMIDQTAAGVCLADLSGNITFANPHLAMMAGCTAAELVGRKLAEFIVPAGVAKYRLDFERLTREGTSFDIEMHLARPGSEDVWCNVNVSAIRDSLGKQVSCVAVFVDISRRKLAAWARRTTRRS